MPRDITVRANTRRLHDLGYGITSATNPHRTANDGKRLHLWGVPHDPAALLTYPEGHCDQALEDASKRQIALLIVTAYLQADARQYKAVSAVLDNYKLTSGPVRIDSFGNRVHAVQYNGADPIYESGARLCFADDDATVLFKQAIKPRIEYRRAGEFQVQTSVVVEPTGSLLLELDGKWENGHVLDTPRRNLPELLYAQVEEIVAAVERARWGARPLALAKDAAA